MVSQPHESSRPTQNEGESSRDADRFAEFVLKTGRQHCSFPGAHAVGINFVSTTDASEQRHIIYVPDCCSDAQVALKDTLEPIASLQSTETTASDSLLPHHEWTATTENLDGVVNRFDQWLNRPENEVVRHASRLPQTVVSFAISHDSRCVPIAVDVANVAAVINSIGAFTARELRTTGHIWLQERSARSGAPKSIRGAIPDIDRRYADILSAIESTALPIPTALWDTLNGHKPLYCFSSPISEAELARFVGLYAMSLAGVDWSCAQPHQAQNLPACIKEKHRQVVCVDERARQLSAKPFQTDLIGRDLPVRLAREISPDVGSSIDTLSIEAMLRAKGFDVPRQPGCTRSSFCLDAEHSGSDCALYRNDSGDLTLACFSDHRGEGQKFWSPAMLHRLATGQDGGATTLGSTTDRIPTTPAGRDLLSHCWSSLCARDGCPAAAKKTLPVILDLVLHARAHRERDRWVRRARRGDFGEFDRLVAPRVEDIVARANKRMVSHATAGRAPWFEYDETLSGMAYTNGSCHPIRVRDSGPRLCRSPYADQLDRHETTHLHGKTTAEAHDGQEIRVLRPVYREVPRLDALLRQALDRLPASLARLGIAETRRLAFPAAYQTPSWTQNDSGLIKGVTVPGLYDTRADFDAVEFLTALWRRGWLPLDSENDVRRLIVALASPLLRYELPGLLGGYLLLGESGSGKKFLERLVFAIWSTVAASPGSRCDVDLPSGRDSALEETLAQAGDCLFLTAKEATRTKGIVRMLIKLLGSATLRARALYAMPFHVVMRYVVLADSADPLPEGRELSRRIVTIETKKLPMVQGAPSPLGLALAEVTRHGRAIVASLQRTIEAQPVEFWRDFPAIDGRPTAQAALAHVLGATLDAVEGASLNGLLRAFYTFRQLRLHDRASADDMRPDPKYPAWANKMPHWSFGELIHTMETLPAHRATFEAYRRPADIVAAVSREFGYRGRRDKRFIGLSVFGEPFVFAHFDKGYAFVFEPKASFERFCPEETVHWIEQAESTPHTEATPIADGMSVPTQPETPQDCLSFSDAQMEALI